MSQRFFLLISLLLTLGAAAQKLPSDFNLSESVEPLLGDCNYGQENPYNLMCPEMNKVVYQGSSDKRAHTGCVATAMSMLMKKWEWPEQPTGSITYTSKDNKDAANTFTLTNNLSDHQYDWTKILSFYGSAATDDEKSAVAQLMLDAGASVKMQYTSFTSDAGHVDAAKALVTNFCYTKDGMQLWYRNTTSDDLWRETIYRELAAGRPILFAGFGAEGGFGHEYVVDGYKTVSDTQGNKSVKLHVNLGFGNGGAYYDFYTHYTYSANFSMVTGIQPEESASTKGFTANVHREGDMKLNKKVLSYNLRNDGLGTLTSTSSKTYTKLAVIRNDIVVGFLGSDNQVVLESTFDEKTYSFDLTGTVTTGSMTIDTDALSPSNFKVHGVTKYTETGNPNQIYIDDVLVPVISEDNGSTWTVADGNETHINSVRIKLDESAEIVDYTYTIYLHGAPYTPDTQKPYIEYYENSGYTYCYTNTITKSSDYALSNFKAFPQDGYDARVWDRHDGDTHELHVTYGKTAIDTEKTYNIRTADGLYLYAEGDELKASNGVYTGDACAQWTVSYDSNYTNQYRLQNKATDTYIIYESGTFKLGVQPETSTKDIRNLTKSLSKDADTWLIQSAHSSTGYLYADETGIGINKTDDYDDVNSTRFVFEEYVEKTPTYGSQTKLTLKAVAGDYYYATFSSESDCFLEKSGGSLTYSYDTSVRVITSNGTKLSANELPTETVTPGTKALKGYFIPAGTGVLIKTMITGAATSIYTPYYTVTDKHIDETPFNGNLLRPSTQTMEDSGYRFYKLAYNNSTDKVLGFYWGATDGASFTMTSKTTAYLAIPSEQAARIQNGISFADLEGENQTTGISALEPFKQQSIEPSGTPWNILKHSTCFSLQGQRLQSGSTLPRGLYIINGKKAVIR